MKFISWNVNGLRACIQKGFLEQFHKLDADFFCLQETKLQPGQLTLDLPGYEQYWCYAEKKGYSGTAIFTKHTPLSVSYGLGVAELDTEGRLITLEYPEFYLVTCYTPNAQRGLARIDHRMRWDEAFRNYIGELDKKKPVILCGDLNVAHKEIDLKNPGSNRGNAGFSDEERDSFTKTLDLGFTDTFRHLHPDTKGAYTWWSYMFHARENNAGWRIDYFLVSDRIKDSIYKTPIYPDIMGSDHCPVGLELDIQCNGGIWSPECIDLAPPKAEEKAPTKSNKTAPAVKAGAIAILVLCLLIGGILQGLSLRNQTTEEISQMISAHVYTTPLNVSVLPLSSRAATLLTDGTSKWEVSGSYFTFQKQLSDRPVNFWVQIDLTELGKEALALSDTIEISFTPNTTGDTQPGVYLHESCCATTGIYYTIDDSSRTLGGWFIYGFIPTDTVATLKFCHKSSSDLSYAYQIGISPYTGPNTSTADLVKECIKIPKLQDQYIYADSLQAYNRYYDAIHDDYASLTNLKYRGYEAAQLLFEHFCNNDDQLMKTCAEALLSLDIYFNQLTSEQQQHFLSNRQYFSEKLATIHVYEKPLTEETIWQDPDKTVENHILNDGEKKWCVDDEDKYFDMRLNHRPINFWIRIDLTDLGRKKLRFADDLRFVFSPYASGYFENETYCTTTRRYFLEDGSMGGWFIYGFIPTVGYADISYESITDINGIQLYSESISPYFYPDAHPEALVSECIQNIELYNAYINAEDLSAFRIEYERLRESNNALKNLEYSAYLAADILFDKFRNNINPYQQPTAEALLSLFLYNNQLTDEQKAYLNENCHYHKEDRYLRPPEIEIPG